MKRSNLAFLENLTAWRPVLSPSTSSRYDERFAGCVEALLEAAKQNNEVAAVGLTETVKALADTISGQARLGVPLAAMLWEQWTAQLLEVEKALAVINTTASRRAFQLLTRLCVAAHDVQTRSGE